MQSIQSACKRLHIATAIPMGLLQGHRCSAVICREVEDMEEVCTSLGGAPPQILFWPSLTGSSVVISPVGDIVFTLPRAAVGMAVFTLGESRFAWVDLA